MWMIGSEVEDREVVQRVMTRGEKREHDEGD